jgi:hypothetical protein
LGDNFFEYIEKCPSSSSSKYSEFTLQPSPTNGTVESLVSLQDSLSGWLMKQSYSVMLSARKAWKERFVVIANSTIYLFTSNDINSEFYDYLPITKSTQLHISDPNLLRFELHTRIFFETADQQHVTRSLYLQCHDQNEMNIWLDAIQDAISHAKQGKKPMPFLDSRFNIEEITSSGYPITPDPSNPSAVSSRSSLEHHDYSFPTPTQTQFLPEYDSIASSWTAIYEHGTSPTHLKPFNYPRRPSIDNTQPNNTNTLAEVSPTSHTNTTKHRHRHQRKKSQSSSLDIYEFVKDLKSMEKQIRDREQNIFMQQDKRRH